jgi:hypothetical protein
MMDLSTFSGLDDHADDAIMGGPERAEYRSVFMADWRLGHPDCRVNEILAFLKNHPSQYLYVSGEVVDALAWRDQKPWPQSHMDVLQKTLKKARKGCRVFIVSNASPLHAWSGRRWGRVSVVPEVVHVGAQGQRLRLGETPRPSTLERWLGRISEAPAAEQMASWLDADTAWLEGFDGQLRAVSLAPATPSPLYA